MHEGHEGNEPVADAVERVGREVVDAALTVHRALGPGLLESAYETCLFEELKRRGLAIERQVSVQVVYGDIRMRPASDWIYSSKGAWASKSSRSTPWRRSIRLRSSPICASRVIGWAT